MRQGRRLHGSGVIAQVEPVSGFGAWRVSVWHTQNPDAASRYPGEFPLLTEALEAADVVARTTFDQSRARPSITRAK